MHGKLNLDKLDLQIIHEMMENAEVSYAELGKKLFVSGGTIHVRIKKLQEFGIVKSARFSECGDATLGLLAGLLDLSD